MHDPPAETIQPLRAVVLTPAHVAERLLLDVRTVTEGRLRRELPWIKLGGRLRMLAHRLDAYLESVEEPVTCMLRTPAQGVGLARRRDARPFGSFSDIH